MFRTVGLVAATLCFLAGYASASPILSITAPSAYTPGNTFDITVSLTGAQELASYSVSLTLSDSNGTAGTDFRFQSASQPLSRYVFTAGGNDGFAYNIPTGQEYEITVDDLLNSGTVNTVAGVNDLVANMTVYTSTSLQGSLTISFDGTKLQLDNASGGDIAGFSELVANLPETAVAPEPATLALLSMGLGLLMRRRRPAG
jgi:hypothetical protein